MSPLASPTKSRSARPWPWLVCAFLFSFGCVCGGTPERDGGLSDGGTGTDGGNPVDGGSGFDGGFGNDGGPSDGGCTGRVPAQHRPSGETCPETRDAGIFSPGTAGCQSDAQCDAGVNGRCYTTAGGALMNVCTYDECFDDSACPSNEPCWCRSIDDANVCVAGSGCRIDSDCGPCGYCSPSPASALDCSPTFQCHTPLDQCLDDSDCADAGVFQPRCAFAAADARWECAGFCAIP